ncbi:MAG TPA: RNA polymerase sigma factor [Polyangiales bacterium]
MRTDEALMLAYQGGDAHAFAELVARHEKPLWNFLRRFTPDAASAEDLLQETFMRVVKSAASYQPSARFSTWLYTIARNLCTDHARSRAHRNAQSLDATSTRDSDAPRMMETVSGADPGGEQRALARELGARLESALAALPALQREVFVMRELLDLPFAEIAVAVGANEATVKSRMRYALERMRLELASLHEQAMEVEP